MEPKETNMKCDICGCEKQYHGFERKLILRGKDKGLYKVTEFYSCVCDKENKDVPEQSN
jgi:hypothetical protein